MTTRAMTASAIVCLLASSALAQQPQPMPPPSVPQPAPATAASPPMPATPAAAPPAPRAPRPPQTPTPAPQPATATPQPMPPAPERQPGQLVNIRIDVTVMEEGGAEPPTRKTTTLILADRQNGSVRATGAQRTERTQDGREVVPPAPRMNVDAFPMMQADGRAQVLLTLDYGRPGAGTSVRVQPLLESGKPLLVSQAVDPSSDRRISVELTATVLK